MPFPDEAILGINFFSALVNSFPNHSWPSATRDVWKWINLCWEKVDSSNCLIRKRYISWFSFLNWVDFIQDIKIAKKLILCSAICIVVLIPTLSATSHHPSFLSVSKGSFTKYVVWFLKLFDPSLPLPQSIQVTNSLNH